MYATLYLEFIYVQILEDLCEWCTVHFFDVTN